MRLIQFYKYIILILLAFNYSETLKPSNSRQLEKIKISSNENTRTYYHLDKNGIIEFKNLGKILDKNKNYTIKIISRAKITKNSNSNKSFGLVLDIEQNGELRSEELKYKKKVSLSKLPDKKGFSYTNAGFWLEEVKNPKDTKIYIKSLKGSPEIEIRVLYDEISSLVNEGIIYPINIRKPISVNFLRDTTYVKSKHWFKLNDDNQFQFKIKGPTILKIRSRSVILDKGAGEYSFDLKENGRKMSVHRYHIISSEKDAHYNDNDKKINLTKYNSFLFNVPPGLNYYTLKSNDNLNTDMFIKIESFIDE